MNTITENALKQLNADKQEVVIDKAQALIAYILKEKAKIDGYRANIKIHQEAVAKLTEDVLTAQDVFGRPASTTPTQNEATILTAIKERNDAKQKCIESSSKSHLVDIDGYLKQIKTAEDELVALRKQLSELAGEEVTAAQVLS